jgi:putative membrane protein
MMHGWNGAWGPGAYAYGFPWGGLLVSAVLIALVVFAVIAFVRSGRAGKVPGDPRERGLEILIERYARGEIDADTFKSMKAEVEAKN